MMSVSLKHIVILNIWSANYRCIVTGIEKSDVVNLLQIANLTEKEEYYKNEKIIFTYKKDK